MGWQDDPVVGDSPNTSVDTDQLQAQAGKYTPDQMASFDRGRGQLLAEEAQSDSPPDPREIQNLNPTQLAAFNQSQPTTTPMAKAPWENDPVASTVMDKVKDVTKSAVKNATTFNQPGTDLLNGTKAMAGGAAAAIDLAGLPISGAYGMGGWIGSMLRGEGLEKSAENFGKFQQALTVGAHLSDPTVKTSYDKGMFLLNWAMDKLRQGGESVTDEMLKSDIPFIKNNAALGGAITEAVANVIAGGGIAKGIGAVGRIGTAARGIPKPATTGESALSKMGLDKPAATGEKPPMFTVKGKPVDAGAEQPLGVDATPEQMTSEFDGRQGGFNFDPHAQGESADLFDPSNRVTAPDQGPQTELLNQQAARQAEMPLEDTTPPPRADVSKTYIEQLEKGQGLTSNPEAGPTTPDILNKTNIEATDAANEQFKNSAWEKYQQRVAELKAKQEEAAYNQKATQDAQAAKYSNDNFQPEQQSPTVEKMLGGTGRRGFRQGGAVNFGNGEDLAKRLEDLKNGLSFTDRSREGIVAGDTVRLMNGKVGTVTEVKDGRYSISAGDFKDSVPIQGIDYKYKPQGNAAENYRKAGEIASKSPLGGVGKKGFGQGGAVNFRSIFNSKDPALHPEEPKGVDIPLNDDAVIDILYKQWNRSSDFEDFRDGLNIEKKLNPNFPQEVLDSASQVWDRFETEGYRPETSQYGSMSSLNQRESADTRPYEQMAKGLELGTKHVTDKVTGETTETTRTLLDTKLRAKDDLNGFTKEIQSPLHIISTNWEKAAGKVYNWAYSNLSDINRQWSTKLANLMSNHEPFLDLTRRSQKAVTGAEIFWDRNVNRQILTDQGLMWPTKEMLMDKQYTGLNSKEADAYLAHAKGYDEGYKAAGIDQPKLPGYMPHTWNGMWRANIYHPTEGLVEVFKGTNRSQALRAVKEAEKQGLTGEVIEPKLSNKHNFVANTQQMIQAANNMGKLGKAFAKVLIDIQDGVMQGTITESLERRGISGYLGDEGLRPESLMNPIQYVKNRTYNNRAMGVYEKAMNDFARAGRNRAIIEAVAKPFFQNLEKFQQANSLVDAVKDLISTATGFRANENIGIDRMIKQFLINRGLNPNLPSQWLTSLNTFARVERINSLNLGFAAEHAAFALPGMWDLLRMHYERGVAGESQGSYLKALAAMGRDTITFGMYKSTEGMRADKWAHDNGIYSSNYYDQANFKGLGGKLWDLASHKTLELVINRAKSVSFQMAYHYFKDIMPEEQALRASANHVKKTMQSFDALDTPEIFKEGYGGKAIRPFNQIHFYNMARAQEMIMAYVRNVKEHPLAGQKLLIPAVGLATTYLLLGGAKGLPFHDDYNLVRGMVNSVDPNANWESFEQMMLESDVPDWVVWGAIPHVTGADIRGTFTFNLNPEDLLHGAGLGVAKNALLLGAAEARKMITGEANPDAIYKNVRALLPTTAVPWLEDAMAEKLGGNIPRPSTLEPQSPRTPAEDKFFKIVSKRAISESMRNEKVDLQKEIDAQNARWRASRTDLIVKKALGFDTGWKDFGDLIKETVTAGRGYNIQQLSAELKKAIPESQIPAAVTFIKKAAAANQGRQAALFNTMIDTLQGGTLGR